MKALAILLLWAAPAFAQHPCDRPEVIAATVTEGAVSVSVCYARLTATWAEVIGSTTITKALTTNGVPNAEGLYEFTGTLTLARGTYAAAVIADGVRTPTQTMTVLAPVPAITCLDGSVVFQVGDELQVQAKANALTTTKAKYAAAHWTLLQPVEKYGPLYYLRFRCGG